VSVGGINAGNVKGVLTIVFYSKLNRTLSNTFYNI